MEEHSELVSQFTAITGANEDRAKFFLESSAWRLDVAMERYYENGGDELEESTPPVEQKPTPTATAKNKPKPESRFATMNSLATHSSDEDEQAQAFYAGGSEHSGQQVLGPKKEKDFVAGMFKSVQEHGVEIVEPRAGSSKAFRGTGYKLGQKEDDSVVVPGAADPLPPPEVVLKLWRDGFSVNEGELREYTDPANREFLESIRRGEIPQELRQGASEVHLAMEDHRMEAFKRAENKIVRPFTGHGYTLGSPAPPVIGSSLEEDRPVNEKKAKDNIKVDSNQPTTNLQIRLADGSRLVGQFNHTHTVGQVREYIVTARPQYQTTTFNLISTYPSRVLDETQTLTEAGLLNSAIMQKLV